MPTIMTANEIFISAGELSGDRHAAALVKQLKTLDPSLTFFGMGHKAMADAGVEIMADLIKQSTVGFLEPIKHIPTFLSVFRRLKKAVKTRRPKAIIVVDFQGFHMTLIKALRKFGIPIYYYIGPQEWLWGAIKGGKKVVANTDMILSIFKAEADFYNKLGGNAKYVGNPTLALAKPTQDRAALCARLEVPETTQLLGVFPGSRPQEIKRMYPTLLRSAIQLAKTRDNCKIVISVSTGVFEDKIRAQMADVDTTGLIVYTDHSYGLIGHLDASLLTSGTIALEHACFGTPAIVAYRFSPLSYWLIKKLFYKKFYETIKWISLPNIIAQEPIMTELIQDEASPEAICKEVGAILDDTTIQKRYADGYAKVKTLMAPEDAVKTAATHIVDSLARLR